MGAVKKVIVVCGKDDCCPTVYINKDEVLIEDDFKGRVKLTSEQFELLKTKIKKGVL